MEHLPWYVPTIFVLTFLIAIWLFLRATHFSRPVITVLVILTIVQSLLGISGFYSNYNSLTTRFPLLVMPSLAIGLVMFLTGKGRSLIDSFDPARLTLMHIFRVGVEIALFWLFTYKYIPQAMTFEGRNFDILSGLTAPIIYYFGFINNRLSRPALIIWNVACIVLLLNVVSSAFLSLPARYTQFGFEQPNIAVGFFPFVLLPAILVPMVLFSHAVTIRQLVLKKVNLKYQPQ